MTSLDSLINYTFHECRTIFAIYNSKYNFQQKDNLTASLNTYHETDKTYSRNHRFYWFSRLY